MPAEENPPPDENSKPYQLQLITGTGRVLWERSLPSHYPTMVLGVSAFSNGQKWLDCYLDVVALATNTLQDSS